jgi:2-oxoglutarate ferredoxin oxidoreductase subunit gamma
MQHDIIISGFGGQGTLTAGQLLANAGMDAGKHVTWIPSYGPEMRGGKARCTVVVADEPIGAPLMTQPTALIVMNIPSWEAFEPMVKPGGVMVTNSSLVPRKSERTDITEIIVPATQIASECGSPKLANVVCLGVLAKATGVMEVDEIARALETYLPARHAKLLPANLEALRRGAALVD